MESDGDFRLENGVMEMEMGEMNKVLVSLMRMLSISRIYINNSSKIDFSSCSSKNSSSGRSINKKRQAQHQPQQQQQH